MAMTQPSRTPKRAGASPRYSLRTRARRALRTWLEVPRAARHSLTWDSLAGACAGAYTGMTFPFFVRIARGNLRAPEAAVALMTAAPFVGNLLSPLWARQMEGGSSRPGGSMRFCLGSWLCARFLLLLMPLAQTAGLFVAFVGGLQFIGTISTPAYTSLMRDIYPDRARGRLMGYVRVVLQISMFFSTLVVGRLLDGGISFRLLFPIAGVMGVAAAFSFSHVRPLARAPYLKDARTPGEEAPPPGVRAFVLDTLSLLRENVGYRWFALSVFTYGFGNLLAAPLYALYQVDRLHISNTQIANLANFASLVSIGGFFFWGRFMDRRGAPRTVLFGILLISLIPAVYLSARTVNGLFLASALSGFGLACIELSYVQSILTYAEPGRAAQYQSLHSLLLGLRGVVAPLLAIPLMRAFGYHRVFALALAIMVVGALMQGAATRRE